MKPAKKSERGNAMLEFALGFFVLWAIFSGIYQFGYAFYVYNALLTSVSNAAQLGSKLTYDTTDSGTAFKAAIKNMVLYGDETAGVTPVVPNLTTANVNVDAHPDATGMPTYVEVGITGYTVNALFTSYSLNNKPRVTTEFYGQITGP
jgi:Flp pilus assembly protein TadG